MTTVLVIDDEPALRDVIRIALESRRYNVIEAADWVVGLRLFRDQRPDLVIIDIMIAGKNGLDAIQEMLESDPQARIIAMSGTIDVGDMSPLKRAETLGAAATLEKPFRRQQLLDLVVRVIGSD